MSKSRESDDLGKYVQQANATLLATLQRLSLHEPAASPCGPPRALFEEPGPSIFDAIEEFTLEESVEVKIAGFELTQFTQRRKDELFKRHKKEQEDQLVQRKREAEKGYNLRESTTKLLKGEFTLHNEQLAKSETYPITAEDLEKLRPETDLNDVIVGTYAKLLQFSFLPPHTSHHLHLYSSFFLEKLIADFVREEVICDRNPAQLLAQVKERVKENYKNVKRWTRKFDLFEKDVLVFPVNAFRHWFCVLVLRPGALLGSQGGKCQLIYCDSMFEQRDFVVEAFRKYLECELEDKKGLTVELNEQNLPCHQLLVTPAPLSCPARPTPTTADSTCSPTSRNSSSRRRNSSSSKLCPADANSTSSPAPSSSPCANASANSSSDSSTARTSRRSTTSSPTTAPRRNASCRARTAPTTTRSTTRSTRSTRR